MNTLATIIGTFLACVYCLVAVIQTICLWLVFKCRKIPFKIKCTHVSFLASDMLISFCIILIILTFWVYDMHVVRVTIVRTCQSIYWANLAHIAIDRSVSVIKPFRYKYLLTNKHAKIWTSLDWTIPIVVTCLSWVYIATVEELPCKTDVHVIKCTQAIGFAHFLMSVLFCFMFISAQIATAVALKLKRRITLQSGNHMSKFTRLLLKLSILKFFLYMPHFTHEVLVTVHDEFVGENWLAVLQLFGLLCHTTGSVITSKFCIWNIKECRLNFIKTFLSWNKRYKRLAYEYELNVYQIPVADRHLSESTLDKFD